MNIRSVAFWTLDAIRGGKVKKELRQVKIDMLGARPDIEKLTNILEYAIRNVPHYKNIQSPDIAAFPVMNKSLYLSDYDGFQSTEFVGQKLYTYYTSGSSGTPFHGVQDNGKRNKHTADFLYFMGKCGWNIGDKYIFLRAWVSTYNTSKIQNIKNNVLPFDVLKLDEKMLSDIIYCVKKKHVKAILGYGSALNQLAEYMEKNNIALTGLNVIISDSDPLRKEWRRVLSERCGCKVVDRYSNEEHGLIAFSYDVDEPFSVNVSSYYVELLKLDSNEYAEPGELGRVVITDLYNKAMPLIRYELGDLAISEENICKGVSVLRGLQGRTSDMLLKKDGVKISSASVNNYMESMNGVNKYQLIQNDIGKFVLYVVEENGYYSDEQYHKTLSPCIDIDSDLKVVRVDSIKTEKTGKYKTFISNYRSV